MSSISDALKKNVPNINLNNEARREAVIRERRENGCAGAERDPALTIAARSMGSELPPDPTALQSISMRTSRPVALMASFGAAGMAACVAFAVYSSMSQASVPMPSAAQSKSGAVANLKQASAIAAPQAKANAVVASITKTNLQVATGEPETSDDFAALFLTDPDDHTSPKTGAAQAEAFGDTHEYDYEQMQAMKASRELKPERVVAMGELKPVMKAVMNPVRRALGEGDAFALSPSKEDGAIEIASANPNLNALVAPQRNPVLAAQQQQKLRADIELQSRASGGGAAAAPVALPPSPSTLGAKTTPGSSHGSDTEPISAVGDTAQGSLLPVPAAAKNADGSEVLFEAQPSNSVAIASAAASASGSAKPASKRTGNVSSASRPRASQDDDNNGALIVSGIFWDAKRPMALIGDKIVEVGTRVGGAEITAIDRSSVTVRENGQERTLHP